MKELIPQNRTQKEYISRINRVIDFIENNIDKELKLDSLAAIANFSPYHFHRIFGAIVGEPLNRFIQRIRLEKAAGRLIANLDKSITEIALDCGFSSSATFARAFKEYFDMAATEWRQQGCPPISKIRKTEGNIGKQDGKDGKESDSPNEYFCSVIDYTFNNRWRIEMTGKNPIQSQVEVKDLPEMHIAYIRHIGPYKGNADLFGQLFGRVFQWAGPRGLIRFPETKTISVYHDDPDVTSEDKLRISVGLTVPPDTKVDGEIGKMTLPGGKYAVAHFELSTDQYEEAWNMVFGSWLPQSGYQPADSPCFELYHNNPDEHPEKKCITDICIPVKPL